MAFIKKGILGGFTGLVGSVVGSKFRNKYVIRSVPDTTERPPTPAQELHLAKFNLAAKFLRAIKPVISLAYQSDGRASSRNLAMKQIIEEAIIGEYPDFAIDYKSVQVSKGNLGDTYAMAAAPEGAAIRFRWKPDVYGEYNAADKAILVAYDPSIRRLHLGIATALRSDGTALLELADFSGAEMETWLTFISPDARRSAFSAYTGKVTVG